MNAPESSPVGPVDALANYWLTRIRLEDQPEPDMQPEWRLELGGAAAALDEYLKWRDARLSRSVSFDLGLAIAESVARDPFGAGPAVRAALDDAIARCGPASWRGAREDRMALRG